MPGSAGRSVARRRSLWLRLALALLVGSAALFAVWPRGPSSYPNPVYFLRFDETNSAGDGTSSAVSASTSPLRVQVWVDPVDAALRLSESYAPNALAVNQDYVRDGKEYVVSEVTSGGAGVPQNGRTPTITVHIQPVSPLMHATLRLLSEAALSGGMGAWLREHAVQPIRHVRDGGRDAIQVVTKAYPFGSVSSVHRASCDLDPATGDPLVCVVYHVEGYYQYVLTDRFIVDKTIAVGSAAADLFDPPQPQAPSVWSTIGDWLRHPGIAW